MVKPKLTLLSKIEKPVNLTGSESEIWSVLDRIEARAERLKNIKLYIKVERQKRKLLKYWQKKKM